MEIRFATKYDAKNISELVTSLSHYYLGQKQKELPDWFLSTMEENEFKNRIKSDEYINLISIEQNELIGYISMNTNGHLYHLFVSEKHQGQGIARQLWNKTTQKYNLSKYTVRSSINAVPVYTAFGFSVTAQEGEKDGIHFQPMELVTRR